MFYATIVLPRSTKLLCIEDIMFSSSFYMMLCVNSVSFQVFSRVTALCHTSLALPFALNRNRKIFTVGEICYVMAGKFVSFVPPIIFYLGLNRPLFEMFY